MTSKNAFLKVAAPVMAIALFLAACGPSAPAPTQIDPNMIFTQAAQTAFANVTLTAMAATSTPAPTATATFTPIPVQQPVGGVPGAIPTVGTVVVIPTLGGATGVQPTASGPLCDNAAWSSDVTIPDGSVVSPGETLVKTWRVLNTGVCTWDDGYGLRYGWGDPTDLFSAWGDFKVDYKDPFSVAPGELADITLTLVAPTEPGNYTGYFRLINDSGYYFGEALSIKITVK